MKVKAADGYTYYLAQALADKVLGGLAKGNQAQETIRQQFLHTRFLRHMSVRILSTRSMSHSMSA